MKVTQTLCAILACVWIAACATSLPPPTATFDGIQQLRAAEIAPLALGDFTRAPELPEARDKSIAIRADSLQPPKGGTFSSFLRQTIEADLKGAGRLDPAADRILSAQLTRSDISTFGSNSRGALGARFRVTQKSAIIFEKQVTVEEEWPSAFLGAVAITDASNHYTGLYPKLWAALLADPEFRAAAR